MADLTPDHLVLGVDTPGRRGRSNTCANATRAAPPR